MTMQIDHAAYAPAFDLGLDAEAPCVSPIAIVALNAVVTAGAVTVLSTMGFGLGLALLAGWIGGGILTLVGLFGLVAADARKTAAAHAFATAPLPLPGRPEDRRGALLDEWEADRQADMTAATVAPRAAVLFERIQKVLRARRAGAAARNWSQCG